MDEQYDPNLIGSLRAPTADSSGSDSETYDPNLIGNLRGSGAQASAPAAKNPSTGSGKKTTSAPRVAASTPYIKSATPISPQNEWANKSWGDVGKSFVKNLAPSTVEGVKNIVNSGVNWRDTLSGLGQLATGLGSQAAGAIGVTQDAAKKAKTEAVANALEQHYKNVYGGLLHGDTSGIKQGLATSPFDMVMDASTLVGGPGDALKLAGIGAKAAGLAETASALGKAGKVASTVGSYLNPVENSIRLARGLTNIPGSIIRGVHSIPTGVAPELLKTASKAGANPFSAEGRAYASHWAGIGTPSDLQTAAQSANRAINAESQNGHFAAINNAPNVQPLHSTALGAVSEAKKAVAPGGVDIGMFDPASKAINKAEELIKAHAEQAAAGTPGYSGVAGMDLLKRSITDLASAESNPVAQGALWQIAAGVKKSITDAYPGYQDVMDASREAMNRSNDIFKTLGLKDKTAASSSISKALNASKNDRGLSLIKELSSKDSRIPYMLAGQATQELGQHNLLNALLAGPAAAALHHPLGILVPFAASSPKLAGALHYGAGLVGGAAENATRLSKLPYYASRPEAIQETQEAPPPPENAPEKNDTLAQAKKEISNIESGGSGGYGAIGPPIPGRKDVAYGKYGVMGNNLPGWTKKYYGRELTPEEFLQDPVAQEAVFEGEFGGYLKSGMSLKDAKSKWFTGRTYDKAVADKAYDKATGMTVQDYVNAGTAATGGRIQRASGGRAGQSHEQLVNRLMTMAKQAKKVTDKSTEPLLNAPDEAIVKALDVAKQAI